VCVTRDVLLVWDGTHFVVPTQVLEKEISASAIYGLILNRQDVLVMEILVGSNKLRAVDILYTNPTYYENCVNVSYENRLSALRQILEKNSKWECVTLENSNCIQSCLQIPDIYSLNTINQRYIFIKPGHTVAAVGLDRQNVLIAYRRHDGSLEYKTKISNNGPASAFLLNEPMRRFDPDDVTVRDSTGNKLFVHNMPNNSDIKMFKYYATVEFRDNSKLGSHIFDGEVSDVSEYKLPLFRDPAKGVNATKVFEKQVTDERLFPQLIKILMKMSEEKRAQLSKCLQPSERITDIDLEYK